jgi:hypothetical protein
MRPPLERLDIQPMASGDHSLLLTERVDWDAFPAYVEAILPLVGGVLVDRADGPDQRVWTVSIRSQLFWMAFDEFPGSVSLDPQNSEASSLIPAIRHMLLRERSHSSNPETS